MTYPLISEYVESILNAEDNFKELTHLRPVLNADGTPFMTGGNFAQIFKMQDADTGKLYAVKCFLREQERREESYQRICEELAQVDSPYLVKVQYYEKELYVHTTGSAETEFPVLLMDWVEGVSLDKYLRDNIDDVFELELLTWNFKQLAVWLLEQPFAHGDLKPDNIIVREDGSLVLVDYDGMYVPAMQGEKARELGSPDFRHPNRTENDFDKHIDDFPIASILLSLKAIALKPELLDEYGAKDRLLFSEADYRDLSKSTIWHNLILLINSKAFVEFYNVFVMVYADHFAEGEYLSSLKVIDFEYHYDLSFFYKSKEEAQNIDGGLINKTKKIFWITKGLGKTYHIPDGIRYISISWVLLHDVGVHSLDMPHSVHMICKYAFGSSLEKIVFSNNLAAISERTFMHCINLQSLQLPDSLLYIDLDAFQNCSSLEYINIPQYARFNEVYRFDDGFDYPWLHPAYHFIGCSKLKQIMVDKRNTRYCDEDGVLFSKDKTILLRYPPGKPTKTYTIPETVKTIGNYAFAECTNLEHILIPSSVTEIESAAFYKCISLKEVAIPSSVKKMGYGVFDYCESIENSIFPESTPVEKLSFTGWKSLKSVKLPKSLKEIDSYMFADCESLKYLELPDSIEFINNGAFKNCINLNNIVLPQNLKMLGGMYSKYGGDNDGVFENCSSLESITIPSSVVGIGYQCFAGCTGLKSVTLPNSLEWLDDFGPLFPKNIKEIVINKPLSTFVINVSHRRTNFVPLSKYVPIEKIRVIDNPDFCIIEGAVFSKDKSILFSVPDNYIHYEIPMGVKEISPLAFKDNVLIESVAFPDSVIKIDCGTFSGCSSLQSIFIPNSVTQIGDNAFYNCNSLQSIVIPDSVTQIGNYAFQTCSSMQSIVIPNSVTEIGSGAFSGCYSLQSIVIPDSVTQIERQAFSGCSSLQSIVIPDSVTQIGDFAFSRCSSLQFIVIPDSVMRIGKLAFSNCSGMQSIAVSEKNVIFDSRNNCNAIIKTENDILVAGCSQTVIPDSVTEIGESAFAFCDNIQTIIIPNSVTRIGEHAFSCCSSLQSIVIPDSVTEIGDDAFDGCSNLHSIIIPKGSKVKFQELLRGYRDLLREE